MANFSTKQLAQMWNVSERGIYKALTIRRLRPDLGEQIMAGTMSLDAAFRIAKGKAKSTSWDRLLTAWNSATNDDHVRLMDHILSTANLQSDTGVVHG